MSIYIEDGYTFTGTLPARPGICPEVRVEFRPALDRKRLEFKQRIDMGDPAKLDTFITELIVAHIVTVNGSPLESPRVPKINPTIRSGLVDLILGYAPHDEAADAKN